jgi:hypothetical protein
MRPRHNSKCRRAELVDSLNVWFEIAVVRSSTVTDSRLWVHVTHGSNALSRLTVYQHTGLCDSYLVLVQNGRVSAVVYPAPASPGQGLTSQLHPPGSCL